MSINFDKIYPNLEGYRQVLDVINNGLANQQSLFVDQQGRVSIANISTRVFDTFKNFFGDAENISRPLDSNMVRQFVAYGQKWNGDPTINKLRLTVISHLAVQNKTQKDTSIKSNKRVLNSFKPWHLLIAALGVSVVYAAVSRLFQVQLECSIPSKNEWGRSGGLDPVSCCSRPGISADCDLFLKEFPTEVLKQYLYVEKNEKTELLKHYGYAVRRAHEEVRFRYFPADRTVNFLNEAIDKLNPLFFSADVALNGFVPSLKDSNTRISQGLLDGVIQNRHRYCVVDFESRLKNIPPNDNGSESALILRLLDEELNTSNPYVPAEAVALKYYSQIIDDAKGKLKGRCQNWKTFHEVVYRTIAKPKTKFVADILLDLAQAEAISAQWDQDPWYIRWRESIARISR